MTTPIHRQPEGIPAGGQFAATTHAEPTTSLAPAVPSQLQPILATVTLQRWVEDGTDNIGHVVFDARRILADLTPEERAGLEDQDSSGDEVFYEAIRRGLAPDHDGPFEVGVRDSMDEALEADPDVFEKIAALPKERAAGEVLETPLSAYEIGARFSADGSLAGLATMDMSDLIDNDLEGHLDSLGEKLVGSPLLMEPSATPVSVASDGQIVVRIEGDPTAVIEGFSEEELADYKAGLAAGAHVRKYRA